MFLNFVVVDPRGPYLYWRDADGNAFTRASAEAFVERHNTLLKFNAPELDGNRLKVCELLPEGHRQRVCELSVEIGDSDLNVWAERLHELAHE